MNIKPVTAIIAASALALGLTACSDTSAFDKRQAAQETKRAKTASLEQTNLKEKIKREERPNAIGYVYVMSFGKIVGYYVTKGKISSSGSQLTPEQEAVKPCSTCDRLVLDGPQDDGTYGAGDDGIFFFTTDGAMVETDLDYIHSDQPLPIEVPLLGGKR